MGLAAPWLPKSSFPTINLKAREPVAPAPGRPYHNPIMVRIIVTFFAALLFWSVPALGQASEAGQPQSLPRSELWIETESGRIAFEVEVARTPDEWGIGLMYRNSMPENHGMLFVYPSARNITMWMMNTYVPLDMVFIQADGTVSSIEENTVPESLDIVSSRGLATAVLELNAGAAMKFGIREGDVVRHAAFKNLLPASVEP